MSFAFKLMIPFRRFLSYILMIWFIVCLVKFIFQLFIIYFYPKVETWKLKTGLQLSSVASDGQEIHNPLNDKESTDCLLISLSKSSLKTIFGLILEFRIRGNFLYWFFAETSRIFKFISFQTIVQSLKESDLSPSLPPP